VRATVTLALHRHRSRSVQFSDCPPPGRTPSRRPARIAQLLALAHHIQRAIDRGTFESQSDVARRLGLTTARVTQVMNLLLLAPDIKERLLELEAVNGLEAISEKQLRALSGARDWPEQRRLAMNILSSNFVVCRNQLRTAMRTPAEPLAHDRSATVD
jgi:hypothetical protein